MSDGSCTSCHKVPLVSKDLPKYCAEVLLNAVTRPNETMPQPPAPMSTADFAVYRSHYEPHYDALLNEFCAQERPGAGASDVVIDHTDDPSVISPPTVMQPLYACAQGVSVRGVVPGAKVEIFLNGTLAASAHSEFGDVAGADFAEGVKDGDVVTARQTLDGVTSALSHPVTAAEFPDSILPTPVIDPSTVYECANRIAVRTVMGARLEAWQNGADSQVINARGGTYYVSPGPEPWEPWGRVHGPGVTMRKD
jgi:hypothetical protein